MMNCKNRIYFVTVVLDDDGYNPTGGGSRSLAWSSGNHKWKKLCMSFELSALESVPNDCLLTSLQSQRQSIECMRGRDHHSELLISNKIFFYMNTFHAQ